MRLLEGVREGPAGRALARVPAVVYKGLCAGVAAAFTAGAIAIGGGTPPSPASIAKAASQAADNLAIAKRNTEGAADDTEALATISSNVQSQLRTSQRLLKIQLGIEGTSKHGLDLSSDLAGAVRSIVRALNTLNERLRGLSTDSARVTDGSRDIRAAAGDLESTLNELIDRFGVVTRQSRRLNRKAKGFEEIRP